MISATVSRASGLVIQSPKSSSSPINFTYEKDVASFFFPGSDATQSTEQVHDEPSQSIEQQSVEELLIL